MTNQSCEYYREKLKDHDVGLHETRPKIHRTQETIQRLKIHATNIENQIRQTELQGQIGGIASRFGPPGVIAAGLVKLEAEIRIARLKDEFDNIEQQISAQERKLDDLHQDLNIHEFGKGFAQDQLVAHNC